MLKIVSYVVLAKLDGVKYSCHLCNNEQIAMQGHIVVHSNIVVLSQ